MRPACVLLLLAACGPSRPELPAAAAGRGRARPNVILIVMDTTRADRCTWGPGERESTPSLGRLAAESRVYLNAWSPSSWTGPAHASLFTGLLPTRHGFLRGRADHLPDDVETLAECLAGAGYRTACFSNNPNVGPLRGLDQGFQTYVPLFRVEPRPLPGGTTGVPGAGAGPPPPVSLHNSAAETCAAALGWIAAARRAASPYLLVLNLMEPHAPYAPPEALARRFARAPIADAERRWAAAFRFPLDGAFTLGALELPSRTLGVLSDLYDAEIAHLDEALGSFVASLRAQGRLDDTVLVVTADHGEHLGEGHRLGHVFSLDPALLRVPLLVRYPRRVTPGVERRVVRLEDVAPTLLELCHERVPEGLDGISLLRDPAGRIALGALGPNEVQAGVLRRSFPDADVRQALTGRRSVFDGRFHLVRDDRGVERFYDLLGDPSAENDLSGRGGPELRRVRALLANAFPDFE